MSNQSSVYEASSSPQVGDIWEDLTPGYHRHVRVVRVGSYEVLIERVELRNGEWVLPPRAPSRFTSLKRFNGKSSGFGLVCRAQTSQPMQRWPGSLA